MEDLVDLVRRSLDPATAREFDRRVADQAAEIREGQAAGRFDNADFAVGLEVEVYAIGAAQSPVEETTADAGDGQASSDGRLRPLPETVFDGPAAKELGLHNAEINTEPSLLDETGLAAQAAEIEDRIARAREAAAAAGAELVLDAMWTIPPAEGSNAYLSDVTERDGVVVAANMRQDPRYVAIENDALRHAGGEITLSVPGAEHAFPSILFESLTTSIQPHLQIPTASSFPEYYNAAIRTLGPVLSLTANSPFLPADLYADVTDPHDLLAETHHELRIAAFEQSVNTTENDKVRVPRDIEDAGDVTRRVIEDDLFAPFLREWMAEGERSSLADAHWEYDHKRGTFWRWLRCVVGGDPIDAANDEHSLRIEYRPIPTQPTVRDVVAAQVFTAGLLRGLVHADHPITELPWAEARRSFYAAARDGIEADLAWVTSAGERTTDTEVIHDELFEFARRGLRAEDVPGERIDEFLAPLARRRAAGMTPSGWKIDRVREHLEDGLALADAITDMQRTYVGLSRSEASFADWL